ncbi:enolase C-terminal domain-like protein [Haloplanus vescus]|uniref:enolase C-terminal domain-like protein n=1 Tax=Haloplanus vescus TaxID=555874 RepID=UPI00159F81BB|nr:enolase C-terminal domain-like protein [Haloplanus vescus]
MSRLRWGGRGIGYKPSPTSGFSSSPACEWIEFDPTDFPVSEALFETPPTLDDGRIALPEEPGLGISLDDGVLDEYRV